MLHRERRGVVARKLSFEDLAEISDLSVWLSDLGDMCGEEGM
jgi:hypothetical protein